MELNKINDVRKKNIIVDYIICYLMITIGVILASVALDIFLVPNHIIDGGITGVSIMMSHVTGIPLSFIIIVLNIPFFILGYRELGKKFLFKVIYAMTLYSFLLNRLESVHEITDDILLATIFGGLILGVGVGFVIRYGGCLDGTETIAILLSKRTALSVGQVILFFNILIYGVASYLFGWDRALYSLLTYFITFKIIDEVSEGLEQAKAVMIITNHGENIANNIRDKLGRTCTILDGEGLISGKKVVLYSVITRMEVSELKNIVENDDSSAFVTISDVSEIVGKHIKRTNKKEFEANQKIQETQKPNESQKDDNNMNK